MTQQEKLYHPLYRWGSLFFLQSFVCLVNADRQMGCNMSCRIAILHTQGLAKKRNICPKASWLS